MTDKRNALTSGVHHVGLAVSRLEESAKFFTHLLQWNEVRRDPDYPAIFVTDGFHLLTLWQLDSQQEIRPFNRKTNTGLHHIALRVTDRDRLEEIYQSLLSAGVEIEFAPELLRSGPAMHMMVYEPSGIRVEFIWPGDS